ncbi:MAG: hypothetical protein HY608_09160 [Planctomycetes bacterium]|nr:hypothetical protein [Planctomycetota bacterium]
MTEEGRSLLLASPSLYAGLVVLRYLRPFATEEELNDSLLRNGSWLHRACPAEVMNVRRLHLFLIQNPDLSPAVAAQIRAGEVSIGMTGNQVCASRGEPKSRNRTVGVWGVHEQWVYERLYVYIENGVVTSYQDSR